MIIINNRVLMKMAKSDSDPRVKWAAIHCYALYCDACQVILLLSSSSSFLHSFVSFFVSFMFHLFVCLLLSFFLLYFSFVPCPPLSLYFCVSVFLFLLLSLLYLLIINDVSTANAPADEFRNGVDDFTSTDPIPK